MEINEFKFSIKCEGSNEQNQLNVPEIILNDESLSLENEIIAGWQNTCTLIILDTLGQLKQSDKKLVCWGRDNGINEVPQNDMQQFTRGSVADFISIGFDSMCAVYFLPQPTILLSAPVEVKCWGACEHGMCAVPVQLQVSSQVRKVSVGMDHACAVDGQLVLLCWGSERQGQTRVPAQFGAEGRLGWDVAAGSQVTCAVRVDDQVQCWGREVRTRPELGSGGGLAGVLRWVHLDKNYKDGNGDRNGRLQHSSLDVPSRVKQQVSGVAAGDSHTCQVVASALRCVGNNNFGQLNVPQGITSIDAVYDIGAENESIEAIADSIMHLMSERKYRETLVSKVDAGQNQTCTVMLNDELDILKELTLTNPQQRKSLRTQEGRLDCFGLNQDGQTTVPAPYEHSTLDVRTSVNHTCATRYVESDPAQLRAHDYKVHARIELACWGSDMQGQLALPAAYARDAERFALGCEHTCVQSRTFHKQGLAPLACAGSNEFGQTEHPDLLGPELSLAFDALLDLQSGDFHLCVLSPAGALLCWGSDLQGQTAVPEPLRRESAAASSLRLGANVSCALYDSESIQFGEQSVSSAVLCWGESADGQLQQPRKTDLLRRVDQRSSPRTHALEEQVKLHKEYNSIDSVKHFLQMDIGFRHVCQAVSGQVECFGNNEHGQCNVLNQLEDS